MCIQREKRFIIIILFYYSIQNVFQLLHTNRGVVHPSARPVGFSSGVVKKMERRDLRMLCYENVSTSCVAFFLIYVKMSDRRFPRIAEISTTGRNTLRRFVIVQLVYVKRLCSLTFIWHVFCMNQGSTTFKCSFSFVTNHIRDRSSAKPSERNLFSGQKVSRSVYTCITSS